MLVRRSASFFITYEGNNMLNKVIFKEVLIATTLLAASGYTVMAQAHCIGGNGNFDPTGIAAPLTVPIINAVSTSPFQIDSYTTVCPLTTTHVTAGIAKRTGGATGVVALEVVKSNGIGNHLTLSDSAANINAVCDVANVDDINPAGGGVFSGNYIPTFGGAGGEYILNVTKDLTATAEYAVQFHCWNGAVEVNPLAPAPAGGPSLEFKRILDH